MKQYLTKAKKQQIRTEKIHDIWAQTLVLMFLEVAKAKKERC